MKNILAFLFVLLAVAGFAQPTLTDIYMPQYMQGSGTGNPPDERRVPYVARVRISGLNPLATYRYNTRLTDAPAGSNNGYGNSIYVDRGNLNSGNFFTATSTSFVSPLGYDEFTTDNTGAYEGWFAVIASIDSRFTPGTVPAYLRILLNNGAGGTNVATRVTSFSPITVINFSNASGAGLRSATNTAFTAKNFVMLWDNTARTGRPIAGAYVESDGQVQSNTAADPYVNFYGTQVDGINNRFGTIIPTALPNGIRAVAQFAFSNGALVNSCTDAAGFAGTVNPTGGVPSETAPVIFDCTPTAAPVYGVTATSTPEICFGQSNGTITATAVNGVTPYTYTIAGPTVNTSGASSGVFTGLTPGAYVVTATDATLPTGAVVTANVTVNGSASALTATAAAPLIACFGGTTAATVTPVGGTAPYTYTMLPAGNTTGATTGVFTGLTAGSYTFTVTDAFGCQVTTAAVVVGAPPAAFVATRTIRGLQGPSLPNSGEFTVSRIGNTGGQSPFSYSIVSGPTINTSGATTGIFTGLSAGSYVLRITDGRGCSDDTTGTINAFAPIVVTATPSSGVLNCNGTDTITVSATGGAQGFAYQTGDTGPKYIFAAGTYTYVVRDLFGNTGSVTVNVAPSSGCPTIAPVQYPLYVQGTGSSDPAQDKKVPYASRMTISGLAPNTTYRYYTKFTRTPGEAAAENGFSIIANKTGNFERATSSNLANPASYGEFTTTASGSATDWFVVEPSSSTDFTPGNQLYLRVMLNNGSTGTQVAIRVTAADPVTVINFTDPAGAPLNARAIRSNTIGSYVPKNFIMLYDNAAGNTRPIAGTYIESDGVRQLSVLNADPTTEGYAPFYGDEVDGQASRWGTIIPSNLPNGIRNITQYGLADGAFVDKCVSVDGLFGSTNTVNPTAGLTPLVIDCAPFSVTFAADPALGQMDITSLSDVSVPAAGLLFTQDYKLKIPFYNLNQVNTTPNGTIRVTVNLGRNLDLANGFVLANAPLNTYFDWTSAIVAGNRVITGTQKADIPEDFASTMVFNVKGILTCSSIITSTIEIVNILNVLVDDDLNNNNSTLNYNLPVTVTTTQVNVTCNGAGNGIINITTSPLAVGSTIVTRNAANTVVGSTTVTTAGATGAVVNGLVPGVYTVTVSTTGLIPASCTNATTVTIVQPAVVTSTVSSQVNNLCNGGNSGGFTVTAAGGTSPYSYTIAGPTVNTSGASTGVFTGLTAGVYTITITDANGCTATNTATITQPTSTAPDITLGSDVSGSLFTTTGTTQTIVYNVAEIAGNAAVGDTIRITRVSGYTINFNNASFFATVNGTTYTLDNARWKIDYSNPAFVSIILTDPANAANPGTLLCLQRVFVAITLTRNTPNVSTFALSSRLRRANGELNLGNQLNSIVFAAE